MVVEEETFYNIFGEEISRSEILNQMIGFYALLLEVGDTRVTDFNEGSEIRNILETVSVPIYFLMEEQNDLALIAFPDTAEGEWLDKHGAHPFIKLARDTGMEAKGYVTFTIPEVATSDVVIPEETIIVSEETGLEYATDGENIIPVGDTSVVASVSCLTVGEDGNADANTITLIDDDYLDIDELTVNNPSKLTGGTDYEEDDEYRERLLAYVRKDDFGSFPYYIELGNSVEGVHDVYLVDAPGYTKKVLVNGNVKPTSDAVLADVLEVYTSLSNKIIDHTFTVGKPKSVNLSLTLNLNVVEEIPESEIENIMKDLFVGGEHVLGFPFEGLNIGEALYASAITSTLELLDGVNNITVINQDTGAELEDIVINHDEVLELGNLQINQTIG